MPAIAGAVSDEIPRRVATARICSVCERPTRAVFLSAAETGRELEARHQFFTRRLNRSFSRHALRDLTNVTLGTPAAILRCMRCGMLIRDAVPSDALFRDDSYDESVLATLHETHVLAFREKAADYRALLPPRARVLEVGSYAGGFLSVAAEWGWSAIGTDIGRDAVRFCVGRGLDARCGDLHECALATTAFDAAFVWNCFEQIANPRDLLAEIHRMLRPSGMLVLRVPDAAFYIHHRQQWEEGADSALGVLAYNNLLGWPHRFGYDAGMLRRLVEPHGYAFQTLLRRAAVRPLRDALRPWARREEAALSANDRHGWIELLFRKR